MRLLEIRYEEACSKLETSKIDLKLRIREADAVLERVAEFREQVDIYKDQITSLRKSKICSLREYKDAKMNVWMARNELSNWQNLLATAEAALVEARKSLDSAKEEVDQINDELSQYGKLYRFPSDDRRSTPSN